MVIGSLIVILGLLFYAMGAAAKNKQGWGAMQYPQLVLGMIAIFVYVGMEVTVQSNMGALLKQPEFGGLDEKYISQFISLIGVVSRSVAGPARWRYSKCRPR